MENIAVLAFAILVILTMGLALFQFLHSIYEKRNFFATNNQIRKYLRTIFPGALTQEVTLPKEIFGKSKSHDPMLVLTLAEFQSPCEIKFFPGWLEGDVAREREIYLFLEQGSPEAFYVRKKRFTPEKLFWSFCVKLGYRTGEIEDRRVLSGDRSFDRWYEAGSSDKHFMRAVLQNREFRDAIRELLTGRFFQITNKERNLRLDYLFRRYRDRPTKQAILEKIDRLSSLPLPHKSKVNGATQQAA